jgi:hypothetical protein
VRLDLRHLLTIAILCFASPGLGQYTRDAAANKKIDEALDVHYLATDFKKAEDVLLGTIEACGNKCKPSTVGRAWMYVGVVRGSGNKDQAGARQAFEQALKADPAVTLDVELATPETRATFEALGGQLVGVDEAQSADQVPESPAAAADGAAAAADKQRAGLECSPGNAKVQTRRSVPVACSGDGEAISMSLRFREFGADEWTTVIMKKVGDYYQGEIPCAATHTAGPLHYFVVATDSAGDPVDTFGSKSEPIIIMLGANVTDEPPAFPGQVAPGRCAAKEICPPDFPGCGEDQGVAHRGNKEWGASCEQSAECASGLLCVEGSCETAPSCVVDADCETGVCRAGKCDIPAGAGTALAPYQRHYFGMHFAVDFGIVGGKDVCRANQSEYDCYLEGTSTPYPTPLPEGVGSEGEPGDAYPGAGIGDGLASGTMRVLASYDYALSSQFTLGGRLGFAFRGGPSRPQAAAFLPLHGEVRVAYWFLGLDEPSVRAYVHGAGGWAQVDLRTRVVASDCSDVASSQDEYSEFLDCINAEGNYDSANEPDLPSRNLDAYKKLGRGFAGAGAGAVFAISEHLGAQLNLNLMYMFPDTGLVIEPSLGGVYSF